MNYLLCLLYLFQMMIFKSTNVEIIHHVWCTWLAFLNFLCSASWSWETLTALYTLRLVLSCFFELTYMEALEWLLTCFSVGPLNTWAWWGVRCSLPVGFCLWVELWRQRGVLVHKAPPLQPRPTPIYGPLIFIIQPVMEKLLSHFLHLNGISPVCSCHIFPT